MSFSFCKHSLCNLPHTGVTTQYLSSVCSDLKLDESVWYNPIQKAVYAVIQEASEVRAFVSDMC